MHNVWYVTQTPFCIVQNCTSRNIRITWQWQFFCLVYPKANSLTPVRKFLESFQAELLDSIWRENITVTDIDQVNITNCNIDDPWDVYDLSTECIDDDRGDIFMNKV
jgi:hypothetical protein